MVLRFPVLLAGTLLAATGAAVTAAAPTVGPAHTKYRMIEQRKLPPGSSVYFPVQELNDWMRDEESFWIPTGVRHVRFEFGPNRVIVRGEVDFAKAVHASSQGGTESMVAALVGRMLSGERPVEVTARIASENGRARVDLDRILVSGVPLEGPALDLLVQNYLRPAFPEAHVAEWFNFDFQVDRLAVSVSGAQVYLAAPAVATKPLRP